MYSMADELGISSPSPYERLKQVNKSQHQEYLKSLADKAKNKAHSIAIFATWPRFLQSIIAIIILVSSIAYIFILLKL